MLIVNLILVEAYFMVSENSINSKAETVFKTEDRTYFYARYEKFLAMKEHF